MKFRYTEKILNNADWMTGDGTITRVQDMDKDYLHNILFFIYKNRNRYWLNCHKTSLIESYTDGDEFFQKVVRHSTLWLSIIDQLNTDDEGFNFPKVDGSRLSGSEWPANHD
ncbi:hypothetical protein [Lactiplantibacillus paraxiangfangensis]|uniref:hypothetical protein n=1 Tax=Lactiplantibacillus paraxiangfangensis TaxID=3076224 RepID=UPI0030C6B7BA